MSPAVESANPRAASGEAETSQCPRLIEVEQRNTGFGGHWLNKVNEWVNSRPDENSR